MQLVNYVAVGQMGLDHGRARNRDVINKWRCLFRVVNW